MSSMRNYTLQLSRSSKQCLVACIDIVMAVAATWGAFSLRLDVWHWPVHYQWHVYQLAPLLAMPVFIKSGLYRAVFRYTGLWAMVSIGKAITIYSALFFAVLLWLHLPEVPRSVGLLQPLLFLLLIAGSRMLARLWLNHNPLKKQKNQTRVLIYGAGAAGAQLAEILRQSSQFTLIGFLDDNLQLQHTIIHGQRVYAPHDIEILINRYVVTEVLLALPSINRWRRNEILNKLRHYQIHVRSLPGLVDLAQGKVTTSDIQELDIEDLLGREPVPPNLALLRRNIMGKVILVTGAGGSIGSELCRQILLFQPTRLLMLDHSEFALYTIHTHLKTFLAELSPRTELSPLLGNVRDYKRMTEICRHWKPNTVYHAAAYKHVPLVEENPAEGLHSNVFGTLITARAAMENNVQDFVLISTDKAVRPTNIMGASKRLAEIILQALSATPSPTFDMFESPTSSHCPVQNNTRFSMVRFGNVLGSSGSVVPLFRQQLKDGGPLTVTHEYATRFFMTIPEAAQLVIQAGAMAAGGEVFVLDMGEPIKIIDLATRIVQLSGLVLKNEIHPHGDIEIKITGLRPGEKI